MGPLLSLLLLAVVPGAVLLLYFRLRDRYEPEPLALVQRAFLLGCLAVFLAVPLERTLHAVGMSLGLGATRLGQVLWLSFVVAGLVEESLKFAAGHLAAYRNHEFDEPFDGIVYFSAAAVGFATVENIAYVLSHGFATGVIRALSSVPGHALWGVIMGYFMGRAKFEADPARRRRLVLEAIAVPIVLHGLYDTFAFTGLHWGVFAAVVYLWSRGLRHMKEHQARSPHRPGATPAPGDGEEA